MLGALLTGLFATRLINPAFGKDAAGNAITTGVMDGHWRQLENQFMSVAIAWGISIIGTLILLFVVDKAMGLRAFAEDETACLDLSQHYEEGYDLNAWQSVLTILVHHWSALDFGSMKRARGDAQPAAPPVTLSSEAV